MKRTREYVIEEIGKFLRDEGGAYDWDEFLSVPIEDRVLDGVRIQCADLRDNYPPRGCRQYCSVEGLGRLAELLKALETEE